jgi:hypothetical protein
VLPAGWVWHHFSAAIMGSTAGFKIGLPSAWTQYIVGQVAHMNQPARNFHLTVNLGLWTYVKPLREAEHLEAVDAKSYNDFSLQALESFNFKSVGYRSASAAELRFSWTKVTGGNWTEIVILVTLNTAAGVQPYDFTLWAPSSTFSSANGTFHSALKTFRVLA